MSKHVVEVRQLRTNYGKAFLNVGDTSGGSLSVGGTSFERPTYLMLAGSHFLLVTFENEAWMAEGLEEFTKHYNQIWCIEDGELISVAARESSRE